MNKPQIFESVQDYLEAEGFTVNGECFVKGAVTIPVDAVIGHTPTTFAQKAREHGWVAMDEVNPPFPAPGGTWTRVIAILSD